MNEMNFPPTVLTIESCIPLLIEATEAVAGWQDTYDDAQDTYEREKANLSIKALGEKMFTDEKSGEHRAAKNDAERKVATEKALQRSEKLGRYRVELRKARNTLRLWKAREENYRLIIRALSETVGV